MPTIEIPAVGLGTWQLEGDQCYEVVKSAIREGYRHIDTAAAYGNEEHVGLAIQHSVVSREDLFVTTKIWHDRYDELGDAVDESIGRLGLEYVDLLLLHWPRPEWTRGGIEVDGMIGEQPQPQLMEPVLTSLLEAKSRAVTRNVGVSNFPRELMKLANDVVKLDAIQIEQHPHLWQPDLTDAAKDRDIAVIGYAPLGSGFDVLEDNIVKDTADEQGADPAELCIGWGTVEAEAVIARARSAEHRQANLRAGGLIVDDDPLETLEGHAIETRRRYFNPGFAPDWDFGPYGVTS